MKTHVTTDADMQLRLRKALLVYESDETAFVTVHEAGMKKGRPDIGPGTPASRPALAELARKLANATAMSGFIPPQLLYMSPRAIAWWRPAAPARIFFDQAQHARKGAREIGTRNAVTPQPDLVFAVTARAWYVWAVVVHEAAPRPGPATQLCRSPYFNVYKHGQICTGNVKLPDTMTPEVLGEYEAAFFGSNFTHPNEPQGLTQHSAGPYAMWRELLDHAEHYMRFPTEWLSPMKQTLSTTIKELEAHVGH